MPVSFVDATKFEKACHLSAHVSENAGDFLVRPVFKHPRGHTWSEHAAYCPRSTSASAFLGLQECALAREWPTTRSSKLLDVGAHRALLEAQATPAKSSKISNCSTASSFLQLESPEFTPGSPLPSKAYSNCLTGGEGKPPELYAEDLPARTRYLHLTAEDLDAPRSKSAPPKLLWAKVNISPSAALGLSTTTQAQMVVNYTAPDIKDENIHRILFRLHSSRNHLNVDETNVQERLKVQEGPPRYEGRGENFHELMTFAVAKERDPDASGDCGKPHVPLKLREPPSVFPEPLPPEKQEPNLSRLKRDAQYKARVRRAIILAKEDHDRVNREGLGGMFQPPLGPHPTGDHKSLALSAYAAPSSIGPTTSPAGLAQTNQGVLGYGALALLFWGPILFGAGIVAGGAVDVWKQGLRADSDEE